MRQISSSLRPKPIAIGLTDFCLEIDAQQISGTATVTGITHDSRSVKPGDLYVAVPGFKQHGIDFVVQAIEAGAVAVLSDAAGVARAQELALDVALIECTNVRHTMALAAAAIYGHPERRLKLIGVTGTNGKTTTAHLIRQIGLANGISMGTLGTLGTYLGNERLEGERTTPESTDLYALLAVMEERGITHVVMEVSSHALALHRVAGLHFAVAIFTNLSQDHLDFHPTMDDYFETKAKLFSACDFAVICIDSLWGRMLARQVHAPTQTVGLDTMLQEDDPNPDWTISDVVTNARFHTEFVVRDAQGQSDQIELAMIGAFNATNATLAIAAWKHLGLPRHQSKSPLINCKQIPGRLELVNSARPEIHAVVDYAHTPDAIAKVLDELRAATQGRLITVFGCGGDRDPLKRPIMGQVAAERSDVVIVTDDNPRSEIPAAIRQQVIAGANEVATSHDVDIREEGDRRTAIELAIHIATPSDIVAVLGKGHETGQEIAGVVHPFDDRVVIGEVAR